MTDVIEEYIEGLDDDVSEINIRLNKNITINLSRFNQLMVFTCSNMYLKHLPQLPPALQTLICDHNQLTYLPQLPESLTHLTCDSNKLDELPQLPSRLKLLWCSYNLLTHLPELPLTLKTLYCSDNLLISLPSLPHKLTTMGCDYNNLISLPRLPYKLKILYCNHNKLTSLPDLPVSLRDLNCSYNNFPDWLADNTYTENSVYLIHKIQALKRFKWLYYLLKFKKQLRDWLWVRVREPKIRDKYHPNNLMKILEETGELDLKELDILMDQW